MGRPSKGERVPVTLRLPRELLDELQSGAEKFDLDRHSFIIAMIVRGLKNWKGS